MVNMKKIFIAVLACMVAVPCWAEDEIVSTARDQKGVNLTIYNNNLALIKDKRGVELPAGKSTLAFKEVSAQIRPETALLSGGVSLLEQNFEYDLLTPESLLNKYVGKEVTVVQRFPLTGEERSEKAQVLSAGENGVVLKIGNRIETGVKGNLVYPDVPADLRDRPTLTMEIANETAGAKDLELSYLSSGLSWRADYVAELNAEDSSLDLNGWVTLINESGASYPNAQLQLVAGEVHVEEMVRKKSTPMVAKMEMMADAAPAMTEEKMFEYHLYTLERPTTIAENQQKQVALLQAHGVQCRKEFLVRGDEEFYRSQIVESSKLPVAVEVEIINDKPSGLGLPLPAGIMRVYKKDSHGLLQFVGEDSIDHTPEKETLQLHLGNAFDITAEKKQTSFKKAGGFGNFNAQYESSYELTVKNAKKEAIQVKVLEPLFGDWEILDESAPHKKESASAASWLLTVPAQSKTSLTYTARVRW